MVPLKPLWPAAVMVEVAVWPDRTTMLVGLAVTVKSVMVRVTVVDAVEQQCVTSEAVILIVQVVNSVVSVPLAVKVSVPDPMTL